MPSARRSTSAMSRSSSTTSTRGESLTHLMVGRGAPSAVEICKSVMATRRRTSTPARRRRARTAPAWPTMPKLEQHHLDLIGLGLVALAAFLAFVLYTGCLLYTSDAADEEDS